MANQWCSRSLSRRAFLRDLTAAAGVAAALPLVAACAQTPAQPAATQAPAAAKPSGNLNVLWNSAHKYTALDELVASFEKEFNAKVQFEYMQPPEIRTKFLATAAAGTPSDFVEEDFMTQEMARWED